MGIQVDNLTMGKTCAQKEFIDFEFDGRHISEFGLVAVFDGDRHNFAASPDFEDETTEVNGVDGQHYWGTKFKPKKMTFTLATDGMTEAQVNDFKNHFRPGKYGSFIEDKLLFRYGYCRVASVINFQMVPFKKEFYHLSSNTVITINEYKGECSVVFVFDDPFLYSRLGWVGLQNNQDGLSAEDKMRAIYQNNIFYIDLNWQGFRPTFCGCNFGEDEFHLGTRPKAFTFYNASTANTLANICIEMVHRFTTNNPNINSPAYFCELYDDINSDNKINLISTTNKMLIDYQTPAFPSPQPSDFVNIMNFTSPNIIYSINKTIQIAQNFCSQTPNNPISELEDKIRLEITNPKVSAWAAHVIRILKTKTNYYNSTSNTFILEGKIDNIDLSFIGGSTQSLNWFQYFNIYMLCLIGENEENIFGLENGGWVFYNYLLNFLGKSQKTTITYSYNKVVGENLQKFLVEEENCSDMMLSPYLKLDGGDTMNMTIGAPNSLHLGQLLLGEETPSGNMVFDMIYSYAYL